MQQKEDNLKSIISHAKESYARKPSDPVPPALSRQALALLAFGLVGTGDACILVCLAMMGGLAFVAKHADRRRGACAEKHAYCAAGERRRLPSSAAAAPPHFGALPGRRR